MIEGVGIAAIHCAYCTFMYPALASWQQDYCFKSHLLHMWSWDCSILDLLHIHVYPALATRLLIYSAISCLRNIHDNSLLRLQLSCGNGAPEPWKWLCKLFIQTPHTWHTYLMVTNAYLSRSPRRPKGLSHNSPRANMYIS